MYVTNSVSDDEKETIRTPKNRVETSPIQNQTTLFLGKVLHRNEFHYKRGFDRAYISKSFERARGPEISLNFN